MLGGIVRSSIPYKKVTDLELSGVCYAVLQSRYYLIPEFKKMSLLDGRDLKHVLPT